MSAVSLKQKDHRRLARSSRLSPAVCPGGRCSSAYDSLSQSAGRGWTGIPGAQAEHPPAQARSEPGHRGVSASDRRWPDRPIGGGTCSHGRQGQQGQAGRSRLGSKLPAEDGCVPVVPSAMSESPVEDDTNSLGDTGMVPQAFPLAVPGSPWPSARPRNALPRSRASRSAWCRARPRYRGRPARLRRCYLSARGARRWPAVAPARALPGRSRAGSHGQWPSTGSAAKGRCPASRRRFAASGASQPPAGLPRPGLRRRITRQLQRPRQASAVGSALGPRSLR